jgi:DNA-binding PadR family transcriptional regulator
MQMNSKYQKEVQTKLTKGLLETIILQYLEQESMHGYQLITKIRKGFGVYFGPSTIYPLLGLLEKKGHIESAWNMNCERPKKVYKLTEQGKNVLNYAEKSLIMIQQKLTRETETEIMANPEAIKQNHVSS